MKQVMVWFHISVQVDPKSYAYKVHGLEAFHITLKKIVKAVRRKRITFEDYKACVFQDSMKEVEHTRFWGERSCD